MDTPDAHPLDARPPTLEDLLTLCKSLNTAGVRYVVVGGMAMIQYGFIRATEDIDLLVEASPENEAKLLDSLSYLPDQAVKDVHPGDVMGFTVVRIADEIVIDLMASACGLTYNDITSTTMTIYNIPIPFASLESLLKMKQTLREKDALDRAFLEEKIRKQSP